MFEEGAEATTGRIAQDVLIGSIERFPRFSITRATKSTFIHVGRWNLNSKKTSFHARWLSCTKKIKGKPTKGMLLVYIFQSFQSVLQDPRIIFFRNLRASTLSSLHQVATEPCMRITCLTDFAAPIKIDQHHLFSIAKNVWFP